MAGEMLAAQKLSLSSMSLSGKSEFKIQLWLPVCSQDRGQQGWALLPALAVRLARVATNLSISSNAGQPWGDSVTRGPESPRREALLQASLKPAARHLLFQELPWAARPLAREAESCPLPFTSSP